MGLSLGDKNKTIKMKVEDEAVMSDVQTEDEMALTTDVETTDAEATDVEATDAETTDAETTDAEATDVEAPFVPMASAGVVEESAGIPLVSAGKKASKKRKASKKSKKAKKAKKSKKTKKRKASRKSKKGKKRRTKRRAPKRKLKLREMIMLIVKSNGKKGMSLASIMKALSARFSFTNGFFVKQTLKWLRKKKVLRRNTKGCYVATGKKLVLGKPFGGKPFRGGRRKGSKSKKSKKAKKSKKSKRSKKKRSRKVTKKSRKSAKKSSRRRRR